MPRLPVNGATREIPVLTSMTPRVERDSREDLFFNLPPMQPVPKVIAEDLPAISRSSVQAQPTINITIGRVEVKATREAAPVPRPSKSNSNSSVMSLQEYLQRRAVGGLR
jgi:hypothetical protein